eukprot:g73761.t1
MHSASHSPEQTIQSASQSPVQIMHSASSSPQHNAPLLGHLLDSSGKELAEVRHSISSQRVLDTQLTLILVPAPHGMHGSSGAPALHVGNEWHLRLVRWTSRSNFNQVWAATRAAELDRRNAAAAELTGLRHHVRMQMAQLGEREDPQLAAAVAGLLEREGELQKELAEFSTHQSVLVEYREERRREAFTLAPGVAAKLPWFACPVLWCPVPPCEEQRFARQRSELLPLDWNPLATEARVGVLEEGWLVEEGAVSGLEGWLPAPLEAPSTPQLSPKQSPQERPDLWEMSALQANLHEPALDKQAGQWCVLALGGYNGSRAVDTMERLNLRTGCWEGMEQRLCTARCGMGATVAHDHFIYAIGGYDGSYLASAERYSPARGWELIAPMQHSRNYLAAAALDGYVYAVGGFDGVSRLKSVERYDPKEDRWVSVAPLSVARTRLAVAVLQGFMYALGGWDGEQLHESVERYDPRRDCWEPMPSMSAPRYELSAAVLGGKLYVVGGSRKTPLRLVECFDPNTNRFTVVRSMNSKRSSLVALVAPLARVNMKGSAAADGADGEEEEEVLLAIGPALAPPPPRHLHAPT